MRYFNLHTHNPTGDAEVLALVNQYPDEFDPAENYFSIGIHPWRIKPDKLESELAFIESKLQDEKCLAVGECGLDKRIETALEVQLDVFEHQLLLAARHKKPVIIHCVAAYGEAIALKNKLGITVPLIVHGFSKSVEAAMQLIDHGFYLSFGKYLLRNPELESVFTKVPDDRIFLETDMVEETIQDVYQLASKYKNLEVKEMKELIGSNFRKVFKHNLNTN
ncbi:MAG: TatD family deoxyribonuclease [Flavobacterium sp.]|nr:MAG: TatD family deoxyribonuclease [Flavobacterium sp.]